MRLGIPGQAHEILAQQGVGAAELREPFFRGAFAFHAHHVEQPFAVQRGTDQAGGNFQRRDDGRIEFAHALPVVEADGADVLSFDQDGHDGRGARLVAGDADPVIALHVLGAEHHALAGHEHRAELVGARFLPGHALRVVAVALHGLADPLGLDLEPLLAVGAQLREGQRGAVHLRGFAEQAQHLRHHFHGVRGFEQQAAGLRRGRQQPLTLLQVLVVQDALGGGGEVNRIDAHGAVLYDSVHGWDILNWG